MGGRNSDAVSLSEQVECVDYRAATLIGASTRREPCRSRHRRDNKRGESDLEKPLSPIEDHRDDEHEERVGECVHQRGIDG